MTDNNSTQFDVETVDELIEEYEAAENDAQREEIAEAVLAETVGQAIPTEFYLALLSQAEITRAASEGGSLGDLHQRVEEQLGEYQREVNLRVRREMANRMW